MLGHTMWIRHLPSQAGTLGHTGSNVTISGLTISGDYPRNTSNAFAEFAASGNNILINDVEFKAFNSIGLNVDSIQSVVTNCIFSGANVSNVSAFGIWADGTSTNSTITDCTFTGCSLNATFIGGESKIENCYFSDNAISDGGQVALSPNNLSAQIIGCTFDKGSGGDSGIEISHTTGPQQEISIIGNKIKNQDHWGIVCESGTSLFRSLTIMNNVVKNCGQATADGHYGAITILGPQTKFTISGNICFDDQAMHTQSYGIQTDNTASNHYVIENNICFNNTLNQILDQATGSDKRVVNNIGSPVAASTITVGTSPFKYTNIDGYPEYIIIVPGTLTAPFAQLKRGTTTIQLVTSSQPLVVLLKQGDAVTVTYSSAPTMAKVPQGSAGKSGSNIGGFNVHLFCNTGMITPICK
jgi:hypothetical protein